MIPLDVLWCSTTNIFCLLPVVLCYKLKLSEGILYFLTGLISFIYHLHHRDYFNEPYITYLDYHAIRCVDLILSDICVYWVATDSRIRLCTLFTILPFEIFIVVSGYPYIRLISEIIWVICNILYIVLKNIKINKTYFYLAVSSSVIEIVFYEILTSKFPIHYNLIHGVHHIFGFLSIYFYIQKDLIKNHLRLSTCENYIL